MTMPDLIPIDVLFGNPERTQPTLSPDGTRLAYLASDDGVLNVFVATVGSPPGAALSADTAVTSDRLRGIRQYQWAYDGIHLLYLQDTGGDENWRLHTVNLATGEVVDRTPFPGVQAQILATSSRKPDEVLVGLNRDDPRFHDVYALRLSTGELSKHVASPGFDEWFIDHDLVVRGGVASTEQGGVRYVLGIGDDERVIHEIAPDDFLINITHPVGFSGDGRRLFFGSVATSDTAELVSLDVTDGTIHVLASDPDYDVYAIFLRAESLADPVTHEPQLAPVIKDRHTYVVIDPAIAPDIEALRADARGEVHVLSRDLADRRWIVSDVVDNGPVRYSLYERASKTTTFLFESEPALSQYALANVEPISFTSRDGLSVHGYVTFPPGVDRTNQPAVLHVHGGPWGGRHMWSYNPINQWIANRGYVCIEIDFRGSGGYGKAFLNASAHEWAGAMHDDLLDGLEHTIDQGWVDRERVGIFGGSYGGYAALVGATFTPDVFRCAVDYVGPSNLITLLESIPPYWVLAARQFTKLLGDPKKDRDDLWARSPLSRVDDIRIPILIAQGANDPRVKQAESEQIVAALEERGVPYEYLLFEDEGHGFARPENREAFHLASERFLAKHLGGRAQDA